MEYIPFMVWSVIISVVLYSCNQRMVQAKRRSARLNEFDIEKKQIFSENATSKLIEVLDQFKLLAIGRESGFFAPFRTYRGRAFKNVLQIKLDDTDVTCFDYDYQEGRSRTEQTVLLFEQQQINFPNFSLRPQTFFDILRRSFGQPIFTIPSHPFFSSIYRIDTKDEAAVRTLFRDPLCKFYERHDQRCTEAQGHKVIYYRPGRQIEPNELQAFIEEGLYVFRLLAKSSANEAKEIGVRPSNVLSTSELPQKP